MAEKRTSTPKRPRGRPRKSADEQDLIRERILQAAREAYAGAGFYGLSVDLVLGKAGLSRPTFYKYFRNTDELIDRVFREINDAFVDELRAAIDRAESPKEKLEAAIEFWLNWAVKNGPLLRPMFAEMYDPRSPISRHRQRTHARLTKELGALIVSQGRPKPATLALDALIQCIEFLGYRYALGSPHNAKSRKITRDTMVRAAMGMLSTRDDWARMTEWARALEIQ